MRFFKDKETNTLYCSSKQSMINHYINHPEKFQEVSEENNLTAKKTFTRAKVVEDEKKQ